MNRTKIVLTIVLAIAAGFIGQSAAARLLTTSGSVARAESNEFNDADSKWEYAAVLKAQYPGSVRGSVYWIVYFKGDRPDVVDVETGVSGSSISKALAKLGSDGWEMVGEGLLEVRAVEARPGTNPPSALYFKRRLRDR